MSLRGYETVNDLRRAFGFPAILPPLLVLGTVACNSERADQLAARQVAEAYAAAWRANDSAAVMATLTDDAVLLPFGVPPVEGTDAIRRFWWPPAGPATTVTRFDDTIAEVKVSGDLAIVRGRADVAFTWVDERRTRQATSRTTYLMVLSRPPDGAWGIWRRMWAPLPD